MKEKKFLYVDEEQVFQINEDLANGAKLKLFVSFGAAKFVDYQKDLVQDFVAEVMEKVGEEEMYDIDVMKSHFEIALQNTNTKLKAFADKVRDVDFFEIKGFVQIVIDNILMASMIGDVSVMIFRKNKLYYSLSNSTNARGKIDLFSDFVEGDLENNDQILYVGTKIADVLDTNDFQEMEQVLASETVHVASFMQDLLHARIDKKAFGFVYSYAISGSTSKAKETHIVRDSVDQDSLFYKIKSQFLKNKYQVTVAILGVFIVFMFINVISQVLKSNTDTIVTSDGVTVGVTIDDIKKDLLLFQ